MESYLLDWANLLLRWLHVITAIAWIGSSFYFVFLDSSLEPAADPKLRAEGVTGRIVSRWVQSLLTVQPRLSWPTRCGPSR